MKKKLIILGLFYCLLTLKLKAQFETIKDSIVQIYGVVMTHDSLYLLPNVNIYVLGTNRGTVSNNQGVFSIVSYKGDTLKFMHSGYKPNYLVIPKDIKGNQLSAIETLSQDTLELPVAIIKPRPTREQFERDFVNYKDINIDLIDRAKANSKSLDRALLNSAVAIDAKESFNANMKQSLQIQPAGGVAPGANLLNVLNPSAWKSFIKSWKSGEFKK